MAFPRDRLVHGYFGVDHDLVGDVVTNKAPDRERAIEHIVFPDR